MNHIPIGNNVEVFITKILETATERNIQVEIDGEMDDLGEFVGTMVEIRRATQLLIIDGIQISERFRKILETLRDLSSGGEIRDSVDNRCKVGIALVRMKNEILIRFDVLEPLWKKEKLEFDDFVESITRFGIL